MESKWSMKCWGKGGPCLLLVWTPTVIRRGFLDGVQLGVPPMSERRIVIEEPCEFETGVVHEGCGYLAHRFCNKCGWIQDEHQCTSRTVIEGIPDEWVERALVRVAAYATHLNDYAKKGLVVDVLQAALFGGGEEEHEPA